MHKYGYLFWGILAGLLAGVAGALILWGSWLLPALGLLWTRVDLINGTAVLLALGAAGGLLYSLVVRRRQLRLLETILSGMALGLVLWIAGPLILVPLLLGFPIQLGSALDHWMPLLAFQFYGIIFSLLYSRWSAGQSRVRVYYACSLLLLAAWLTPMLLRAALSTNPEALELPKGYRAAVVAKGFTYPTSIVIAEDETIYLAESGFAYGPKTTEARILQVTPDGRVSEVVKDLKGPINGLALHKDLLFVSHRGTITALNLESGDREDLVTGLPSLGDHQNNDLLIAGGALYFGQGSATNAGVVGADNFVYAWADRYPHFHDQPSRDFVLTGENYESRDLSSPDPAATRTTGAFAPFGQTRKAGERVKAVVPASAAVHKLDLESGELSIYADGLRNPYGLAVDDQGRLYATNLGYDDRGVRAVAGSPDWLVRLKKGSWYGWPDYAGDKPLTETVFSSERGENRRPLIENPPPVEPPLAVFPPHYSPMKMDFAPGQFEEEGLFVAIFGDGQPLTEDLKEVVPTGIMRVDPESGRYDWFIKNSGKPRAGRTGNGFKRLIDVKFGPDGKSMYVLDFGVLEFTDMAPNAIPHTGVVWKITAE